MTKAKTATGTSATKRTPARTVRASGKGASAVGAAAHMAQAATDAVRRQAETGDALAGTGLDGGAVATSGATSAEVEQAAVGEVVQRPGADIEATTGDVSQVGAAGPVAGEAVGSQGGAALDPTAGMSDRERDAYHQGIGEGAAIILDAQEQQRLTAEAARPKLSPYAQHYAAGAVEAATAAGRATLSREYEHQRLQAIGFLEAMVAHAHLALAGLKWEAENHVPIAGAIQNVARLLGLADEAFGKRFELAGLDAFMTASREAGTAQAQGA